MDNVFLRRVSSFVMIAFTTGQLAPAALAAKGDNLPQYFVAAVDAYHRAAPAYAAKGISAFFAELPKGSLSLNDEQFITQQLHGFGPLPVVTLVSADQVTVAPASRVSDVKPIEIRVVDASRNLFTVNGVQFAGRLTAEENYQRVLAIVSRGTAQTERVQINIFDHIVPRAQAGGISTKTLLIAGLVAAVAGLITYFVVKNSSKSSDKTSSSSKGPAVGDSTKISEEATH